jgi:O-antigen/teichoic acid export membrane protein
MIQSTTALFSVVAAAGLGMTAAKHVAQFRKADRTRVGRLIGGASVFSAGSGLVIGLIVFVASPWLAVGVLADHSIGPWLRIGALIIVLEAMNAAQLGALQGFEAFRSIAKANFAVGVLQVPFLVGGAVTYGVPGVLIAMGCVRVAGLGFNYWLLGRECAERSIVISYRGIRAESGLLLSFGLPALMSSLVVVAVNWTGNAILARSLGGYEELGVFNAANQWRLVALWFPSSLGAIVLPILANLRGEQDDREYGRMLRLSAMLNVAMACVICLPIGLFATRIMTGFGDEFRDGETTLLLLLGSVVVAALNNVVGQALASRDRMWIGAGFNVLWGVTLVFSAWWWVGMGYGARALAAANLMAYSVHTFWQWLYFLRSYSFAVSPRGEVD